MKKIVLASSNKGKIKEFTEIFSELSIQVVPQTEFNVPDADETGLSFIENAILKARQCAKYTNLPSFADDSGLEIDALNGDPGIYSARYAGGHGDDSSNTAKVLDNMKDISNRTARFQCAIAYVRYELDPCPLIFTGNVEGAILHKPSGKNGFGYDPIFRPTGYNISFAEIPKEIKNKISHRANALEKLIREFNKTVIL